MITIKQTTAVGLCAALVLLAFSPAIASPPPGGNKWGKKGGQIASRDVSDPLTDSEIIDPNHSIARVWNETLLDAIRLDRPKPPVHSRNLFHASVAMWDAWAAYDAVAVGYISMDKYDADDVDSARREAISYAAYRVLMYRFPGGGIDPDGQPCQPGAETSQADFIAKMEALGYDPDFDSTEGDSPAAIGNRIGEAVIAYGQTDGATEGSDMCYPDPSGYFPSNPSLVFDLPGTQVIRANQWQKLAFDYLVLQNGIIIGQALQEFVGVAWGGTKSFAIPPVPAGETPDPSDCTSIGGAMSPIFDPGCAPQLAGVGDQEVKDSIVELVAFSSYVDPTDGVTMDLSPSVRGNSPLGTDDHQGHPLNPFTGEPYEPNVVMRGDWARIIAEFWADGPDSETPPGHWNTLANYVTDHPELGPLRIGGVGREVDLLEWEVKLYLAVNGAVHDAAIAAWGTKHFYDSSRPITLIRHMGGLGQSSDPAAGSFDPDGLPLVPGLIEIITAETTAAGERHEHLANRIGEIAIYAWQGEPNDPQNEIGGVGWIRAVEWMTYQASNFVTPPFPGYTSGHSTFSRAGAEVLAAFTGNEYFPGGMGRFTAEQNEYLAFEEGPSQTVTLQWATYADAADEAGLSRRYGGIHPWYDDFPGRVQGRDIGVEAYARAQVFYNRNEQGKAYVCHTRPAHKNRQRTLVVAEQAVPAHLRHGDTLGQCPDVEPEPELQPHPGKGRSSSGVSTVGTVDSGVQTFGEDSGGLPGRARGQER
jgi:hypothetical protein